MALPNRSAVARITLAFTAVGKLLLNVNAANNALSGQRLKQQQRQSGDRRVVAAAIDEALAMAAAHQHRASQARPDITRIVFCQLARP